MNGPVAGGTWRLYLPGTSPIHRLPAHAKVLAATATAVAVVATPAAQVWAFGLHLALVAVVVAVAGLTWRRVLRRAAVELPFLVFAVLLPFVAAGPRRDVLGLTVSQDGLLAGWSIVAKGTLGVMVSIVLAATTTPADLVAGLQRLRLPTVLVQIIAFTVRYADVVLDQVHRMRLARAARAFEPTGVRDLPVLAHAAGTLFVRSYEQGERVHRSMLARGWTGELPPLGDHASSVAARSGWVVALPVSCAVVALLARGLA